jgi:hypothetical protein
MFTTPKRRRGRRLSVSAKVALASTAALAALVGTGVSTASASPVSHAQGDTVELVAYTQDIKPWQTVSIPSLSCTGAYPYLVAASYSPPGVLVPPGVKVEQTGAIGVYINGTASQEAYVNNQEYMWSYGTLPTDNSGHTASATNWDLTQDHVLRIDIFCTSNFVKGGGYPS